MSLCGWVVGIASHGSIVLSRHWLITVEAPEHPGHPPYMYIQHDAAVNPLTPGPPSIDEQNCVALDRFKYITCKSHSYL